MRAASFSTLLPPLLAVFVCSDVSGVCSQSVALHLQARPAPPRNLEACIEQELLWVQRNCARKTFDQIESSLFECACRLNAVKKLGRVPPLRQLDPEPRTVSLLSHASRDAISGRATLQADVLLLAEVSMRHLRAPGGVYKGKCANPFKVPQLQGCGTLVVRALNTLSDVSFCYFLGKLSSFPRV